MKKKILMLLFCFVVATITLTIASKCSFLYPFNGWDDFNTFYTVGSNWAKGVIPYVDLFEQKGPLLYLIFMIGSLISSYKFIGIYIMEIIFFTLTLYSSSKIVDLFIDKKKKWRYIIILLYAVIVVTSKAFIEGGSSEEFNLLFITISCYYLLKYLYKGKLQDISYRDLFINGLCCGASFMIKYTTVGFWFLFMAFVCLSLIKDKRYGVAVKKGLMFILGMVIPFGFFVLYFYLNDGLYDFVNTYFYINIFKYGNNFNLFIKIARVIYYMFMGIFSNLLVCGMLLLIFYYYLYLAYKNGSFRKLKIFNKKKISFIVITLGAIGVSYWAQSFRPYSILVFSFYILGLIIYLYKLFGKYKLFNIIVCIGIVLLLGFKIDYTDIKADDSEVVQYRFAEIINQYEDATLLHYRSIDEGFYTASGILPINKYFHQVNINIDDLPESIYEQDMLIRDKKVMFVVVRKFDLDDFSFFDPVNIRDQRDFNEREYTKYLDMNYEIVDEYKSTNGYYKKCIYYLYKVKD